MTNVLRDKLLTTGLLLLVVVGGGTAGYYALGSMGNAAPHWGLSDCLYMTVITLTTVGFGEVIDVSGVPGGRLFTMAILICGLGVSAYFISTLTAFLVEGELRNVYWRKRMSKAIAKLNRHVILCGAGRVGQHILAELLKTGRDLVLIEQNEARILELQEQYGVFPAMVGDPTHGRFLREAGIERATGVITTLGDDKDNLCVVVTCRQLNPGIRVISRCNETGFAGKLELVGADVVIPNFIGGLRMASQMVRPKVVRYLDAMLRDKGCTVRIEDFPVPENSRLVGTTLDKLDLAGFGNILLLAVMKQGETSPLYNPPPSYLVGARDILVFQAEQGAFARFGEAYG